jgi:hypothetical protein
MRRLVGGVGIQGEVVLEVAEEIGPSHGRILRKKILTSRKVIHRMRNLLPFFHDSGYFNFSQHKAVLGFQTDQ